MLVIGSSGEKAWLGPFSTALQESNVKPYLNIEEWCPFIIYCVSTLGNIARVTWLLWNVYRPWSHKNHYRIEVLETGTPFLDWSDSGTFVFSNTCSLPVLLRCPLTLVPFCRSFSPDRDTTSLAFTMGRSRDTRGGRLSLKLYYFKCTLPAFYPIYSLLWRSTYPLSVLNSFRIKSSFLESASLWQLITPRASITASERKSSWNSQAVTGELRDHSGYRDTHRKLRWIKCLAAAIWTNNLR
jgi:hypothetical protein